jgi:hypothetical protein
MRITSPALACALASGLAVTIALCVAPRATAQDGGEGPRCSNATLRGSYGLAVSGIRAIGPTETEQFVAVGIRTYDGRGGFTDVASFHGSKQGVLADGHVGGTYDVNGDCTGKSSFTVILPGGFPVTIESAFVILDRGRTVQEAVMSPQPNIVTAVFQRM